MKFGIQILKFDSEVGILNFELLPELIRVDRNRLWEEREFHEIGHFQQSENSLPHLKSTMIFWAGGSIVEDSGKLEEDAEVVEETFELVDWKKLKLRKNFSSSYQILSTIWTRSNNFFILWSWNWIKMSISCISWRRSCFQNFGNQLIPTLVESDLVVETVEVPSEKSSSEMPESVTNEEGEVLPSFSPSFSFIFAITSLLRARSGVTWFDEISLPWNFRIYGFLSDWVYRLFLERVNIIFYFGPKNFVSSKFEIFYS